MARRTDRVRPACGHCSGFDSGRQAKASNDAGGASGAISAASARPRVAGAFDITRANGLVTLRMAPCACSQIELIAGRPRISRASLSGCSNHAICTSFCNFIHARERSPVPASCGSQISILRPLARKGDAPASVPRLSPVTYQRTGLRRLNCQAEVFYQRLDDIEKRARFLDLPRRASPDRSAPDGHAQFERELVRRTPMWRRPECRRRRAACRARAALRPRLALMTYSMSHSQRRIVAQSSVRAARCAGNPRRSRVHRALRGQAADRAPGARGYAAQLAASAADGSANGRRR